MKTRIKLNSDMLHNLVSCGLYETAISPTVYFNDEYLEYFYNEIDINEFWEVFDNQKYKDIIKEIVTDLIPTNIQLANNLNMGIDVLNIKSSTYYNYSNDELEFNVTIDIERLYDEVLSNENVEAFSEFLNKTYKSCEGFWCFMPNSIYEFENSTDIERKVSCAVNFLLDKIQFEKIDEFLIHDELEISPYDVISIDYEFTHVEI